MDADQILIAAGLGFGRRVHAAALYDAVGAAAQRAGRRPHLLAIPAFRAEEESAAALREAALRLGLPLRLIPRAALLRVQPLTRSRSEKALATVGLAAVAEAAALAALAPGARLLLPKEKHGAVTVAFALGRAVAEGAA